MNIYVTSFCNFAHDLKDGVPIGHECYVIPPAALKAERDGCTCDHPAWQAFYKSNRRTHRGRKFKFTRAQNQCAKEVIDKILQEMPSENS